MMNLYLLSIEDSHLEKQKYIPWMDFDMKKGVYKFVCYLLKIAVEARAIFDTIPWEMPTAFGKPERFFTL